MKKYLEKCLSILVVIAMLLSSNSVVFAGSEDGNGSITPYFGTDENVIDYSHAKFGANGYSFALSGNEYRYQTFTATKDAPIEAVEVAVYKKNAVTAGFIDLKAVLFEASKDDGKPIGNPLAESAVLSGDQVKSATPGADVTADMITRFEVSYSLVKDHKYAVVLMSSKVTGAGDDVSGGGQCYDWFTASNPEIVGEFFGKTNGIDPNNWVDESGLGTGWLKVYYQAKAPSVDYTFDSTGNGFGFGAPENEWRWQSFTSTADAPMESVDIRVTKQSHSLEDSGLEKINNLVVALFATDEGGLPIGAPLAQTVVPESSIVSKEAKNIPLYYDLKNGVRYAIAMTMETPLSKHGGKDCYAWATSNAIDSAIATGEKFGKTNISKDINNNTPVDGKWVVEALGTGYLKVNYSAVRTPEVLVDYTYEIKKNTGYTMAVEDCAHRFQTFSLPTKTRITSLGISVLKLGDTNKEDQYAHTDLIVKIFATDPDTKMPTGNALATATVPVASVINKQEIPVEIAAQLEAGRYAVAITQTILPPNGGKDNPVYDWPTQPTVDPDEKFGKLHGNGGTADESGLGTGYLKVVGIAEPPSGPVASKIEISADRGIIAIGEKSVLTATVFDQFGEMMDGQVVKYVSADPSKATVTDNTVTAISGGTAVINAKCGRATATVSIAIKDENGMVAPAPGLVIKENVKFLPGTYNFDSTKQGLIIDGNDIIVDGTGVVIRNVDPAITAEDVTSGSYAYKINPIEGKHKYMLTRKINLSNAKDIRVSFDVKGTNFVGDMKIYASTDKATWTELKTAKAAESWAKITADLSAYSGQTTYVRIAYENDADVPADMTLKLDTIELFEDNVRTFSDLTEAKAFYWWDISYDDGVRVADDLKNKPFDRTDYSRAWKSKFKGVGISADGVSNVTIKGFTLSGFKDAMVIKNSKAVNITENNMSNNYVDPGEKDGWGDQLGGALTLDKVSNSSITKNIANNNANGVYMKFSDNNTITDNDFSICSDVCLEMWKSSNNDIRNNDFSWGIRIDPDQEVHARDSTSQLMEAGSNFNYFYRNDFTHGGDGIFIRVGNGYSCEGNVFEENDTSFANNNAVESWAGRNYFIRNKVNYSSYGFWLGGTDESEVMYNEVAYNGVMPANAAERGAGNGGLVYLNGTAEHIKLVGNYIHDNNGSGIALRYDVSKRTDGYVAGHALIQNNRIENTTKGAGNGDAIYLDCIDDVIVSGNKMTGNVNNGVFKNPNGKYPVTNVVERDGVYQDTQVAYDAVAPVAKLTSNTTKYVVGQEITFSATGSTSPAGKELTYKWTMGDNFGASATRKSGETIKFTFDEPGYYDVGLTVTDGTWSDIAWINVNVVSAGTEIGTDEDASKWSGNVKPFATPVEGQKMFFSGKSKSENVAKMVTKNKISLVGATSATLTYQTAFDIEPQWDIANVKVSTDGTTWVSLGTDSMFKDKVAFEGTYGDNNNPEGKEPFRNQLPAYTSSTHGQWINETIDLSAYIGQEIYLMYCVSTDWGAEGTGLYVDDIKVTTDAGIIFADNAESKSLKWDYTDFVVMDGSTSATFINETRKDPVLHATIPEVAKYASYMTHYVLQGEQSIYLESKQAKNTLSYPASRDLGADFSKDNALSLSVKIHDEKNWFSANSPTIKLYTDDNNYFTYQAKDTFLSPLNYADIKSGQWRSEWVPLYIPYAGSKLWEKSQTGSPDMANINYIEFVADTSGDGTYLWLDGMKSVYTGELTPYYGANLSIEGTSVASSNAPESTPETPLMANFVPAKAWVSEATATSYYGVSYTAPRYVDRIEMFLSGNALGDTQVALPTSYKVEYLANGTWAEVTNFAKPLKIKSGQNSVMFDAVNATGVRVVFTNVAGKAVSVYGLKTVNSRNYAAEQDLNGKNLSNVSTTIITDSELDSVDMVLNINNKAFWPQAYGDFVVNVYAIDNATNGPTGAVLATGTVTKDVITEKGFGKIYNIPLRTASGEKFILKSGLRYVIGATQNPMSDDHDASGGAHYRWATTKTIEQGKNEQFGKIDSFGASVSGHVEDLGTGWLRIHTDKDVDGKASIDFSWEPLPTSGFGVGHASGEPGRYQTFTSPVDPAVYMIDGKVNDTNSWSTVGQTTDQSVTVTLNKVRPVKSVNIFFEEGKVPASFTVSANGSVLATVTDAKAGFNTVTFNEVSTNAITVTVPVNTVIKELEIMPVAGEVVIPDTNKADLEALIGYAKAQKQADEYKYVVPAVKTALDARLLTAETIVANVYATQVQIDQAYDQLLQVVQMLSYTGNNTTLKELYDVWKDFEADLYKPDAVDAMTAALEKARGVLANENALQAEIDEAFKALDDARANLQAKINKEALLKLINSTNYNLDKYLPVGKDAFIAARAQAEAVYANANATDKEVATAYNNLLTTSWALRLIPDKTALEALINSAKNINRALYTAESAARVDACVAKAEAVFADKFADEAQVADAAAGLRKALNGLVLVEDKTDTNTETDKDTTTDDKTTTDTTKDTTVPKTSDNTPLAVAFALAMVGCACVVAKRKQNDKA